MIKSIFKYTFVIALLFGLWSLLLGYFPFLLFFLFVIVLCFSLLVSLKAMHHTDISVECDVRFAKRNDNVYLSFHRDDSLLVHCGQIIVEYEIVDVFNQCMKHQKITILDQMAMDVISFAHCGFYTIQIRQMRCYDILQCFYHRQSSQRTLSLYVLPKYQKTDIKVLESFQEHPDAIEYATLHGGQDYSEVYELRNYQETDSLHHIHWKASLKKNELLVKVGSQPIIKRIILAMLYQQNNDYSDSQFDIFYSLCTDLLGKQVPFEVLVPQCHDIPAHSEYISHIEQLRDVLLKIMKTPVKQFDNIPQNQKIYMIQGDRIEVYHT